MNLMNHTRLLAMVTALAAAPAFMATLAFAEQPATAGQTKPSTTPPVMNDAQDPMLGDEKAGGAQVAPSSPSSPSAAPAAPAPKADAKGAAGPSTKDVAVGAPVFGADGKKVGEVKGVKSEPSGTIQEIHVKTGGLLGIGSKIVVVPGGKIAKGGQQVQLAMTSEEVGKLPELADKQG